MNYVYARNFLATAASVNDNGTKTDGNGITSRKIAIGNKASIGALTVWFTPGTPAAFPIDFEFAVSCDDGLTWTTGLAANAWRRIRINTNDDAIGGVVKTTMEVNFHGVSHVKLHRIKVASGAGNCTVINARLSIGR